MYHLFMLNHLVFVVARKVKEAGGFLMSRSQDVPFSGKNFWLAFIRLRK